MKMIFLATVMGLLTPITVCSEGIENIIMEVADIGKIYSLNINAKDINKQCLLEKIRVIVSYIDNQQISPYRVEIWKGHSLVEEALRQETIKIERYLPKDYVLIPIQHKGQRIILYNFKKQTYAMYGIDSKDPKIDFSVCFNH